MAMQTTGYRAAMIRALAPYIREIAQKLGWKGGNASECQVAIALSGCGVTPAEAWEQFRYGPYRLDFAFPDVQVAIEADGWVHGTKVVSRRDRERDRVLRSWGWLVIRVDVESETVSVAEQVSQAVKQVRMLAGHTRANGV